MRTIEPFRIHFEKALFDDLHRRIDEARIVDVPMGEDWQFGTPASFLKEVLQKWKSDYDWYDTHCYGSSRRLLGRSGWVYLQNNT